jgi:adenylate cyclase
MASTRRLAAILAADVAGYSRLMGADEEGTLERLKAHLREVIEPQIREHHGRIVKTTGDGVLAEFASVVDAVRCANVIQRAMAERDLDIAEKRRLRFRIGINLGDVIADGNDIFGDGVNIAARLEGLAAPGGICVSGTVRDHIGDRLPYAFEDMGEQSVRNIARPVRVYTLRPEGSADATPANMAPTGSHPPPVAAPRLSIVVLPFTNLSSDPEQEYFADGITEDLTTDLSRLAGMLVISRNTAFTYRDKSLDTKQIGSELGVRYVLEGSVRRLGSHIRINAQLIDAESDTHLWAERFNGDTSDLFSLQDEITSRIAATLSIELVRAEAARPAQHPDALDYILRGRAAFSKSASPETYIEAITLYEQALRLEPRSFEAQTLLARTLASRVLDQMTDSAAADIERAEGLIAQALAGAISSPLAHFAKGHVLRAKRRPEEAVLEYEMAIALNPNWVFAYVALGACKILTGEMDEAIRLSEKGIRLSPRDPNIGAMYAQIGRAHLLQSRIEQAVLWLEKARSANPVHPAFRANLASAYALNGQRKLAAAELAEARRLSPDDRYSSLSRLRIREQHEGLVPKVRARFEATYFAGLSKAGMPEE